MENAVHLCKARKLRRFESLGQTSHVLGMPRHMNLNTPEATSTYRMCKKSQRDTELNVETRLPLLLHQQDIICFP